MPTKYVIAGMLVAAAGVAVVWSCEGDEGDSEFREGSDAMTGSVSLTAADGSAPGADGFRDKGDVYLGGGPGKNAPEGSTGLPQGDYYYQVTDPSGHELLSTDHISCRRIDVNHAGVIDKIHQGTNYVWQRDRWMAVPCRHAAGVDPERVVHDAITVQLAPFDDTPNAGGVYKVWLTPMAEYRGDPDYVPQVEGDLVNGEGTGPGDFHGFARSESKTGNFRVDPEHAGPRPSISVAVFHDADFDGVQGPDEPEVVGWPVTVTDPATLTNEYYTPARILAYEGKWSVVDTLTERSRVTVGMLGEDQQSQYPDGDPFVAVAVHPSTDGVLPVTFGNVGLGEISACMVYDGDGDGAVGAGEVRMTKGDITLLGRDLHGEAIGPVTKTVGDRGCAVFSELMPGSYELTYALESGTNNDHEWSWAATGETTQSVEIRSILDGSTIAGTSVEVLFTAQCRGVTTFESPVYWHGIEGLAEVTKSDLMFINDLIVYARASSYFDAGDEPFDGKRTDGTDVGAAHDGRKVLAAAGTPQAELSSFLVEGSATWDTREVLAQQLLAFVLNTRHRLPGTEVSIRLLDGELVPVATLIDKAVRAWQMEGGQVPDQEAVANVFRALANANSVAYVPRDPC